MSILITGGTGFIAAEIARILCARGETDITVFDIDDSTRRLDEIAGEVRMVRGDIGEIGEVRDCVGASSPAVIYHLAGLLSVPSEADPQAAVRVNAMGTYHVLEAARQFGVGKVIFASSIGTYGHGVGDAIDDLTLQRPVLIYGACKLFGEHLGLFYRRKYGIDFRGLRYPPVVGPGVRSPGVTQYAPWVIEECAKGNPFTNWVRPDTRAPLLYFKDIARATVTLADAPAERIQMVNYLLAGSTASAGELAAMVRRKLPEAQIDFAVDEERQALLDHLKPLDDRCAREEWGWEASYDLEAMVDDFLDELQKHPQRYESSPPPAK